MGLKDMLVRKQGGAMPYPGSGLLGFEAMGWLSLGWAQEIASRGEGQTSIVSPRIIIKPERHPAGPGFDAAVDLGVMGGGKPFPGVEAECAVSGNSPCWSCDGSPAPKVSNGRPFLGS
jgi:hypothetical protein